VNRVRVLRVLDLTPLALALIHHFETDLTRSFCVDLIYDVS